MKIKIAPSILSADFSCLASDIKKAESAGADMFHIDVMDGHFVPNITIGAVVVQHIRKITKLPLDVHLMISEPQKYIDDFVASGADMITVHIETIGVSGLCYQAKRLALKGVRIGVSLNPNTPLAKIKNALKYTDFVLVMSVNPGFSGQKFIPKVLPKIRELRAMFKGDIAVDGGINDLTAKDAYLAGANILVAASYIFNSNNYKKAIRRLKNVG
ncbi:MAG: ribulose-phosphate 3-epimerase [Candidatus Omnitrophota bacterium]|nr:ribulose-phosphate 3-epimerase [Candidatus Omnitrophota bacterium]